MYSRWEQKVLSYFLLFPTVPGTPRSTMDMNEYARIKWMPAEEQMFALWDSFLQTVPCFERSSLSVLFFFPCEASLCLAHFACGGASSGGHLENSVWKEGIDMRLHFKVLKWRRDRDWERRERDTCTYMCLIWCLSTPWPGGLLDHTVEH